MVNYRLIDHNVVGKVRNSQVSRTFVYSRRGAWALVDHVLCPIPASIYILMCFPQNKWMPVVGPFDFQNAETVFIMCYGCKTSVWFYLR